MTKQTLAKILGWGQVVVTYLNDALAANGGVIPTTRAAWFRLGMSLLLGASIHHASETSAGHPDGDKTKVNLEAK